MSLTWYVCRDRIGVKPGVKPNKQNTRARNFLTCAGGDGGSRTPRSAFIDIYRGSSLPSNSAILRPGKPALFVVYRQHWRQAHSGRHGSHVDGVSEAVSARCSA
jgi:hypothetical protein